MYSMAKNQVNIEAQCRQIVKDAGNGRFSPVYLLMGEEPYYPEMVCKAILDHCIPEEDKDFNETVCYGADVDADHVVTLARRYPMMSERQLVVVKEAQMMKDIEGVAAYCKAPLDSTVLVLLLRGASLDKRKALYKEISRCGTVVDSPAVRDYAIAGWISDYYAGRGLRIDPRAAALLGELLLRPYTQDGIFCPDYTAGERQNLVAAEENYEYANLRYMKGDLSGFEMREAQQSLLDAEERLLVAEYDTKMCEISLLQLSGKVLSYLEE